MKNIRRFYYFILLVSLSIVLGSCGDFIKYYVSEERTIPAIIQVNTSIKKTWEAPFTSEDAKKAINIPSNAEDIQVRVKSISLQIIPEADNQANFVSYSMSAYAPVGQEYLKFLNLNTYEALNYSDKPQSVNNNLKASEITLLNQILSKLFDEKSALKSIKFYGDIDGKGGIEGPTKTFIGKVIAQVSVDISYSRCKYTEVATFIDEKCK